MGLDTTHDCWHGPYSAFHRWRKEVASACGIDLMAMYGYASEGISWDTVRDPITALLNHSDCDGEIAVEDLLPLAERLEEIAPRLGGPDLEGWDHRSRALRFAAGCRHAASMGEPVEFH